MKGSTVKRGRSWSYILDLSPGPDGKRRQQWRSGYRTQREADQALRKEVHDRETGTFLQPSKQTLGEYLEEWLAGVGADLRPTSTAAYEWALRRHVITHLGKLPLQGVTAPQFSKLFGDLREGGLSARSVGYVASIASIAIGAAVEEGLIIKNPVTGARKPRAERARGEANMGAVSTSRLPRVRHERSSLRRLCTHRHDGNAPR